MDLKFKISVFFSCVLSALLAVFSLYVYDQIHDRVIAGKVANLHATVLHEWKHLQLHHGKSGMDTLQTQNVYLRLWKNGKLDHDHYPERFKNISEEELLSNHQILAQEIYRKVGTDEYRLQGIYDLNDTESYFMTLRRVLYMGCALAFFLTLPLSWALTRSLLSPFRELSQKTLELDAEQLSFRFPEAKRRDEYGILVRSINGLLTRLERSFKLTRRFAANASHELRTPLTIIRGEAELMLRRERSPQDYQGALTTVLAQAEKLQGIINRLLFLADLERMEQEGVKTQIDVGKVINETLVVLRQAHSSPKSVQVEGDFLIYSGDQELFTSVISNLIENALKYSRSLVRVRFSKIRQGLQVTVEDDGPGIPESKRDMVFEPFVKLANSQSTPGSHGIGLSIVRACLQVARGRIVLGESTQYGGLSVQLFLPA